MPLKVVHALAAAKDGPDAPPNPASPHSSSSSSRPSAASAADSHAPHGARDDWLPSSEWVMSSWLPFDEARLYDVLDTDRAELASWLNDRRTLGAFAAKRGHRSRIELVETLLAPRLRGRRRPSSGACARARWTCSPRRISLAT